MTNAPRVKGTRAESAARAWLRDETGFPVERSALRGNRDVGDLIGLPSTVVEVKNTRLPDPRAWARELTAEMRNAEAGDGVVLWSPHGVGVNQVDRWVAFTFPQTRVAVVPQFGPLNQLHKYVALMDANGYYVNLADAMLDARLASSWLGDWREDRARGGYPYAATVGGVS